MKNAFNNDTWNKKENSTNKNEQNPVKKDGSSQESAMGKYVREEKNNREDKNCNDKTCQR